MITNDEMNEIANMIDDEMQKYCLKGDVGIIILVTPKRKELRVLPKYENEDLIAALNHLAWKFKEV